MEVRTPVAGFNGQVAGVAFADGVGQTENDAALAYFRRHGYHVGTLPEPTAESTTEIDDSADSSDMMPGPSWTVKQLRAWAADHGVLLPSGAKKDEILEALANGPVSSDPVEGSQATDLAEDLPDDEFDGLESDDE